MMLGKIRKYKIIILIICMAAVIFNYDRVTAKIFRLAPSSLENRLAQEYLPDKFWLHRVNSVEKQREFAAKYAGLEFDIIFYESERAFENSHDKENLQAHNLEEQFKQYAALPSQNKLWLDFKNLSLDNKDEALKMLSALMEKYRIAKDKVWVESGCWQALGAFKQAGFKTSYYFPYYKFKELSQNEIEGIKTKTIAIAASGNVDAVSFQGDYYAFVSSLQLPPRIALLSWLDGQRWYEVLWRRKYADIRNDDRVKVILVKDTGRYHR